MQTRSTLGSEKGWLIVKGEKAAALEVPLTCTAGNCRKNHAGKDIKAEILMNIAGCGIILLKGVRAWAV